MNSKNDMIARVIVEGNQDRNELSHDSPCSILATDSHPTMEVKMSKNAAKKKLRWERLKETMPERRRKEKEAKKLKKKLKAIQSKDAAILPVKDTTDNDSVPLSNKRRK